MIAYPIDKLKIWTGEALEQTNKEPIKGVIDDAPPNLTGTQVAMRTGSKWTILPEYPTPPAPSVPVPSVVSMRQARLALLHAGLLVTVEQTLDALDEPTRSAAKIEWEYAQEVVREYPWVAQLTAAMGMTDEQVDGLFELAATL